MNEAVDPKSQTSRQMRVQNIFNEKRTKSYKNQNQNPEEKQKNPQRGKNANVKKSKEQKWVQQKQNDTLGKQTTN